MKQFIRGLVSGTGTQLDGLTLILTTWEYDDESKWHVTGWENEDDEKMMQFIHQNDEDYKDMPIKEFKRLWDSEGYEPCMSLCLDMANVKVTENLKKEV